MKQRLGKFGSIFLALALCLALTGAAFAMWSDTVVVEETVSTGTVCVEFGELPCNMDDEAAPPPYHPTLTPDVTCDPGFTNFRSLDKNVAWGECTYVDTDGDGIKDKLEITLYNVYPCYYNHVTFSTHNCGTIPVILDKILLKWDTKEVEIIYDGQEVTMDLNGNDIDDFEIWWGDHIGDQQEPCISWDYSIGMHFLQDEDATIQNTTLTFTIELEFVQWNKAS